MDTGLLRQLLNYGPLNDLSAQYRNVARHRGKKRACLAVGHSILTISYHLISNDSAYYKDLGEDDFQTRSKTKLAESREYQY